MSFNFQIKHGLTENEFLECFHFMKSYLVSIYGTSSINNDNFNIWKSNRLNNQNRYFIKIYKNKEVCGYAEFMVLNERELYFCDIIIKEELRMSRVVYEFVKFMLNLEQIKNFQEITFHINRNNKQSFRTWSHLNIELTEVGKISNKYKVERKEVEKFIKKLNL